MIPYTSRSRIAVSSPTRRRRWPRRRHPGKSSYPREVGLAWPDVRTAPRRSCRSPYTGRCGASTERSFPSGVRFRRSNRRAEETRVGLEIGVTAALPVLCGREAVRLAEGPAERPGAGISSPHGDILDPHWRLGEIDGGALQSQALDRADNRFAADRMIDAMPMKGRHCGHVSECLQI